MKPILVTYSSSASYDSRIRLLQTQRVIACLASLGLPYKVVYTDRPEALDDSLWSAAIVIQARNLTPSRPFANGLKPYPVMVGITDGGLASHAATWLSNAGNRYPDHDSTGSATYTAMVGDADLCMGWTGQHGEWFAYDINVVPDLPVAVPVLTVDIAANQHAGWAAGAGEGKAVVWYRDFSATGGNIVLWNPSKNAIPGLLAFLRLAGITPPRPYRLCIDLDDMPTDYWNAGYGPPVDAANGIDHCISALVARNTMALCGWNNALIAQTTDAAIARMQAGYDAGVFRNIIHHHIAGIAGENYWTENAAPYDTVIKKLAAYDADIAAWAARGVTIERSGLHGFMYMPANGSDRLGRRAMSSIGIKRIRWPATVNRPRSIGGLVESLVEPGQDTLKMTWSNGNFAAMGAATYRWSLAIVAGAPDTGSEQEYLARQVAIITQSMDYNLYHMMNHAMNVASAAAFPGDDLPLLRWMRMVFDPLVRLGGTDVIRYASEQDWADIAEGN